MDLLSIIIIIMGFIVTGFITLGYLVEAIQTAKNKDK
jgi:hypothetical protein